MLLLFMFLILDSLFFISLSLGASIYAAITYMLIMLKFKCLVRMSLIITKCLLDSSTLCMGLYLSSHASSPNLLCIPMSVSGTTIIQLPRKSLLDF